MFPILHVRATRAGIEKYQASLREEWSKETLEDTLNLLWTILGEHKSSLPWADVLASGIDKITTKDLNLEIAGIIKQLSAVFPDADLPKAATLTAPLDANGRGSRALAQAEKTWTYLVLQAKTNFQGDVGFFQDVQSLLFLCAVHYLLPQLKSQKLTAAHAYLLNAMHVHTLLAWRNQPEHQYYLQSVLMTYLEKHDRRLELLDLSLRLTRVADHSYLTKASALWCDLRDAGQHKQALDLLLYLTKVCPPGYMDEITEMIAETVEFRSAS